jgi:Taurine catabolism dioxygenase TauD, TfdA family
MYKSLIAQTLHYFARPHQAPRQSPIEGAAAWRGAELTKDTSWRQRLSEHDLAELERALAVAKASGRELEEMRAEDLPLPTLAKKLDGWRREVAEGRGFVVIQGLPVERWGADDSARAFYGLGLHLGVPGAQNPEGHLLGHVRNTGADPRNTRRYRTSADLAYHCDAADLVGLLCLQPARSGGLSRLASSITVYNTLLAEKPQLVERLYRPFLLDTHGEGGIDYVPIPACRYAGGQLRTFWQADYFRSAHEYERAPSFDDDERAVLEAYDAIAARPEIHLDMELGKGDIQLLSNHTILHARTAFEDHDEPEQRRHLLRLWVSLSPQLSLRDRASRAGSLTRILASFARARIDRRLHGRSPRRPS